MFSPNVVNLNLKLRVNVSPTPIYQFASLPPKATCWFPPDCVTFPGFAAYDEPLYPALYTVADEIGGTPYATSLSVHIPSAILIYSAKNS